MKKPSTSQNVVVEYTDFRQFLPWLTQLAFVLALGLVAARGMMSEILREPFDTSPSTTAAPRACGPAGSVVLDLLCCVPALLILLRRILDKTYIVRLTLAQSLLAMFAGLALLSTLWSGDKFQALVLSMHLVAAAAMFWAMAQLVRSWMRLRLVAGLCLGLLLIYVAQGLMYKYVDVPDTVRYWKAHRVEEMRARGWQEGDFALDQYEKKLLNGEMMGFHSSPNSFAATLVMLSVVVAGLGVQRFANKDESGITGATLLALPAALLIIGFTHSNAALATPVIATGILVCVWRFGEVLNRKRTLVYLAGVIAVVLGTLALIGHGKFHGSLPSASLNFRWRYWVASWDIFKAHPLVGVGYGNFGYWYLGSRLAAAGEEIKDPHNLLVRALTELGIVGAILLVAWLARVWWEWTSSAMPAHAPARIESSRKEWPPAAGTLHYASKATANPSKYGPRRMFGTIVSLSIVGILIKLLAAIDFSADAGWVSYELLKHLVFGALLLIGYALASVASTKDMSLDDRPAPWVLYAMLAALAVFLIHNTIDFSLFETGPMLLFAGIGGAVLGVRSPSAAGLRKRTPIAIGAFAGVLIAWLVAIGLIAIPLIDAEHRADEGTDAMRKQNYRLAAEHFSAAYANAPARNADYALRAAGALRGVPNSDALIIARLSDAITASPIDPMGYLTRARYNVQVHPDQQAGIRRDFDQALAINPHDIDTRLEYAKLLDDFGDRSGARAQYEAALKTNDGYDATEPKRLSAAHLEEIKTRLAS